MHTNTHHTLGRTTPCRQCGGIGRLVIKRDDTPEFINSRTRVPCPACGGRGRVARDVPGSATR